MATQSPAFTQWLDRFFASYYRHRPVNATFIGVHEYDGRLPDFSAAGVGDTLADMQDLLAGLEALPAEPLTRMERIDRELAQGFLRIQMWEYESSHFQRGNPCTYTGEAIFGIIALFLMAFAPLEQRVESAIQRMEQIPRFLRQARANLHQSPPAWTERAIRECRGALIFLSNGIELLAHDEAIHEPRLSAAAGRAAAAFQAFQDYLETELRHRPSGGYACGEAAFDLYMRSGHALDMSAEEIVEYAEAQMLETEAYLKDHAPDFGAQARQEVLARLADEHPTAETYYDCYTELWTACRDLTMAKDLLTWPDFPIRYVLQPHWAREAAPYLYFLFYRAPAAFNHPPVHQYLVTPLDLTRSAAEQEKLLRSINDSVIKLNHVVHHGSIGHHVQNWHAYRSASRIGQVAAVDCASRIAMFCGGTMAEGWACYATDLMQEAGFLSPLEAYAERQSRLRMAARAVVDVRLHQGRFSLEEAAAYYERRADMGQEAARGEAVKNSMYPGAAMMYLIGADRIHQCRERVAQQEGTSFSLQGFHDRFLAYGSLPVALICAQMEGEAHGVE
jgi:hypothetical protein